MGPAAVKALITEAEAAFGADPAYLIAMSEQAALIQYKRRIYSIRQEAKEAEQAARAECEDNPGVACANRSACGFGDCRFAKADRQMVHTAARETGTARVARGTPYRLDDAIAALIQLRGVVR